METACFSETLVPTDESTRRQNLEEYHHPHRRENFKSYSILSCNNSFLRCAVCEKICKFCLSCMGYSAPRYRLKLNSLDHLHLTVLTTFNVEFYQHSWSRLGYDKSRLTDTSSPLSVGLYFIRSRGSSVSIVSDYGLDSQGSIPDRSRGFFF
jgi:hypothetical protein